MDILKQNLRMNAYIVILKLIKRKFIIIIISFIHFRNDKITYCGIEHESSLNMLLSLSKKENGLSEHQVNLINIINKGYSDKQIAK